jgi:hypothetical protein
MLTLLCFLISANQMPDKLRQIPRSHQMSNVKRMTGINVVCAKDSLFRSFYLDSLSPCRSEAQSLVSEWGMKPAMASGCRTGPPAYVAWLAGTTTQRHSRLHPPG